MNSIIPQRHGFEAQFNAAARSSAVESYQGINGTNWYCCIGFDSSGVIINGEGLSRGGSQRQGTVDRRHSEKSEQEHALTLDSDALNPWKNASGGSFVEWYCLLMSGIDQLRELPVSERIQLVEDLWDTIAVASESIRLTEAQTTDLIDLRKIPRRELSGVT